MAETRTPMVAGNWKMNGLTTEAVDLAAGVAAGAEEAPCDLVVCPPAVYLAVVGDALEGSGVGLGGQDCHPETKGAHTGDVSAQMLADVGCGYVIVGHSERRTNHHEADALVQAKAAAAHAAGLTAIICIGETEDERDRGETLSVVHTQLEGSLPASATAANTVIAYEPVWAIGTGRTPTADEVQEVHARIRDGLADLRGAADAAGTRLLYGGSVKPDNAAELLGLADVDGALVGGASLKVEDFLAIASHSR